MKSKRGEYFIPDFSTEKSAPSDSEGPQGQTRQEFGPLCGVTQGLRQHKKAQTKNPGLPRAFGKSSSDLPHDPCGANFAVAKFGFMRLAIQKARQGIKKGQTPFGACIVKNGKIVSTAHNMVWKNSDITAHAEVNAIRQACKRLKTIDLSGCVIYSTCEPCPMCFSACHWARISKIIYGAQIKDAGRFGFHELTISCQKMKQLGKSPVKIEKNFLCKENLELFRFWARQKNKRSY